ncbi:MAG: major royal jelly protein [Mucilaginibacter sp.]|nr:major royal jelly protein [Mucilaginibacter sp.]
MKALIWITALFNTAVMAQTKPQLIPVAKSSTQVWNGVTTTEDGRVFVGFPRLEGEKGISIGEVLKDGSIVPYPSKTWNSWASGEATTQKFIRINSLRIGPDGNLWVMDTGAPKLGEQTLKDGSKLVVIDVKQNKVIRIIPLDGVMKPNSFMDDLRIYGSTIYITDAGEPALVIMDKITGKGRRVLENHWSTTDSKPLLAEGKVIHLNDGKELRVNADQMEISPDGKWFYFQPVSGPLARTATVYLNDAKLNDKQLAGHITKWFTSPTTGGTAIDAAGNIYLSDVDHCRILKINPAGKSEVVLEDKRLIWADALWIDQKGFLWIPAGQINRLAAFQNGKSTVKFPVYVYKLQVHAKPFKS